jgi:hypothetical protein
LSRIPCPNPDCDRPAKAGLLCGACQAELQRALDGVPALVADLHDTLSRQTSRTTGGGRASETALPYDVRASEAMWVLRSALVGWVRVMQEARSEPWPRDSSASMAAWLSARLERLVRHPAAPEAHGEITTAVRAAQRAVDRAPERLYAGPCPECETSLHVRPGATRTTCRECGTGINVTERRQWMRDQCEDLLGTPSEVSAICAGLGVTVSPSTIRVWVSRKKLFPRRFVRPIKEGGKPRALYRVGDVIKKASGAEDDTAYTVEGDSYAVG